MIDEAILTALIEKKPVYLEIPVNLNGVKIPVPSPLSFVPPAKVSALVRSHPVRSLLVFFASAFLLC
jgi:TPP-dependent 2-oxoacid decarboxylase